MLHLLGWVRDQFQSGQQAVVSNVDWLRPVPSILLKFSESNRTSNQASEVCIYRQIGFTLSQTTKALKESRGIALFLTSALEGGEGSASRPGHTLPWEGPGTHCTGGWEGLRASLDRRRKSHPQPDSIPGPFSPYAVAILTTLPGPLCVYIHIYQKVNFQTVLHLVLSCILKNGTL